MLEISLIVSILALLFGGILAKGIRKKSQGTPKMREISDLIYKGALSYLKKQYQILVVFVIIVAIVLFLVISWQTAAAFVMGAIFISAILATIVKFFGEGLVTESALAGFLLDKFPIILGLLPSQFDSIRDFFQ